MKQGLFLLFLLAALGGCSPSAEQQPQQTTTFLVSGHDTTPPREAVEVRRFEVAPDTVRRGEPVTVHVELAKPASRRLSIDWHAPDGWVISHDVIDASQLRIEETLPAGELDERGRYRVVLRSRGQSLAEDTVAVAE